MLDAPVATLFGIGPTLKKKLKELHIETYEDLIFYYPRRFDDFSAVLSVSELTAGITATVTGTVQLIGNRRSRFGKMITEALITDDTGSVKALWFNQPFITQNIPIGSRVRLSGKTSDNFLDLS